MWIMAETTVTTITITALRLSNLSAHSTCSLPASMKVKSGVTNSLPPIATWKNRITPSTPDMHMAAQVTNCAPRSVIQRPKKPAMTAPSSGRNTAATDTGLSLHQIDVFDRDGAAVAEIDHEDREPDRRFRGGDRQHEHREDLP